MNTTNLALAATVGVLYGCGTYLVLQRSLLRVVLGFVLFGHGANLLLLLAGGPAGPVPHTDSPLSTMSDPLPEAMAITAVVITFGTTALLLALTHRALTLHGDDVHATGPVADRSMDGAP